MRAQRGSVSAQRLHQAALCARTCAMVSAVSRDDQLMGPSAAQLVSVTAEGVGSGIVWQLASASSASAGSIGSRDALPLALQLFGDLGGTACGPVGLALPFDRTRFQKAEQARQQRWHALEQANEKAHRISQT